MKLSIISVNLNNLDGLNKTIESVVTQTFNGYEYIIVDGGSSDGSVDLIKRFSDKITYWISETDKGIYNAMNKGIKKASGDYCLFLNSGDYFAESAILENCFKDEFNEDLIYGNVIHDSHGRLVTYKLPETLSFYNFYIDSIAHPGTFIKRNLFNEVGLYNENYRIVSDWEFFLKAVFLKNATMRYIDNEIAVVNCDGISMNSEGLCKEERDQVLKELFPRFIGDYEKLFFYSDKSTQIHSRNIFFRLVAKGFNVLIKITRDLLHK
jgi:glycosyltransferase involved in cell wall biosynthesis